MIVTFAYLPTMITPDLPDMSHRLLSEAISRRVMVALT
jgi:hypothetical protein